MAAAIDTPPYQHNPYDLGQRAPEEDEMAQGLNPSAPAFEPQRFSVTPMTDEDFMEIVPTLIDVPVPVEIEANPGLDLKLPSIAPDLVCLDDPPLSRLFVRCNPNLEHNELRAIFDKFGDVQQLKMIFNKITNKFKGKVFVKYAKASSAALAKEELHGIEMNGAVMYVQMAEPFRKGVDYKVRPKLIDETDFPPHSRLFITCPREMSNQDLHVVFSEFGEVQHIVLLKHLETGTSRGLGFVKYSSAASAGLAAMHFMQQRERGGQPRILCRIAEPRSSHRQICRQYPNTCSPATPTPIALGYGEACEEQRSCYGDVCYCGECWTTYNPHYTAYAEPRKFNMLRAYNYYSSHSEYISYPPDAYYSGYNPVRYSAHPHYTTNAHSPSHVGPRSVSHYPVVPSYPLVTTGGEEISSTSSDKIATLGDSSRCISPRPSPASTSPVTSTPTTTSSGEPLPGDARLFITFSRPLRPVALRAVFSQFGELASVYLLPEKNYGYAQYYSVEPARRAVEALHNRFVEGVACRVLFADPYQGPAPTRSARSAQTAPDPTLTPIPNTAPDAKEPKKTAVDRISAEIEATHRQLLGRGPTTPTSLGSSENGTTEVSSEGCEQA